MKNYPVPQPRSLAVGTKVQRPPNVPSHLPAFPDPHTYIKTPVSGMLAQSECEQWCQKWKGHIHGAVSYTHLTLPTILRV